jgi:DNA helicase-2/ATP-dependent DNA helicase PcrA
VPLAGAAGIQLPHPIHIASERVQNALLGDAMTAVGVVAQGLRKNLDRFRRTAIDRIDGVDGWEVGDRGLTDVCLKYEELLRQQGLLDFDDIVLISARLIETSGSVRKCIRARFPVLLVDEYQDLGVPLHRIVMALCFDAGVRLFAVGDPDQSIYGFTGARPDLLQSLASRPDIEKVELRINYRSGRRIVAACEYALGEARGYVAFRTEDGMVEITHCPGGLSDQVAHVVTTLIPSFLAVNNTPGDIAVLYPSQQEGDALEQAFVNAGMPFVRLDRGAGYRRTPLIRLIEDLAAWCCGGWSEGEPRLSYLLGKWRVILSGLARIDERAARSSLIRFLFAHRDPVGCCREWLTAFDQEVFNVYLRDVIDVGEDDRDAFEELLTITGMHGTLAELEIGMFAGKSGSSQHVCLMNLHTAKGTEFNVVVLVGMDNGRLPSYRAATKDELLEQRRVFFVGVSRARRIVHLLYSGFTVNQYGRRFDKGASPFLVELQRKLGTSAEDTRFRKLV